MMSDRQFPTLQQLIHGEDLIRPDELAKALKVSVGTVYAWIERRTIPFIALGKSRRFDPVDIKDWIQDRRRAAIKAPGGGPAT